MTTLTHSPAPWRVRPSQERAYCLFIEDADGCQVARLDASNEAWGGMDDDQFLQGDAALMAVSPGLLAACRKIAAVLQFEPSKASDALIAYRRAATSALAAIAQADAPVEVLAKPIGGAQ